MESNNDFELLKKQFENNITDWYPFKQDKKYKIIKKFDKESVKDFEEIVNEVEDDVIILILADNKLGLKNICYKTDKQENLYNRKEIEEILDKNGLNYRKFYYPLPNYQTTNVIFTDNHLPDLETITRNIIFHSKDNVCFCDEINQYRKILQQDPQIFKVFANTFFIECSKNELNDNSIEFVSFSNMRKEQYRIKTIIKGNYVYKAEANEKSKEHLNQIKKNIDILNKLGLLTLDSYDEFNIISKYQKGSKTLDKIIVENIKNNNIEFAKDIINKYYNELKEKLVLINNENNVFDKYKIDYEDEDIENINFVKYGLWDLIFQNIFYIDNKFYAYDQEWIEENLPLEYILYRAFFYNNELKKLIDIDELYKEFNITEKNLNIFKKLDDIIQKNNRDELCWKLNSRNLNAAQRIKQLEKDKEQISSDCIKLLNEKDARISFLEDNMKRTVKELEQRKTELMIIKNSKSWKFIELVKGFKNKKNKTL